MSLEQAIAEQTAAIKEQTAVLTKLVTAAAIIAAGNKAPQILSGAADTKKAAEPEVGTGEQESEKKPTRRQRESRMDVPVKDENNLPPPAAERVLPEGERDEAYYKAHVQPTLLKLAGMDKDVLIDMFKKFGVKSGKELTPDTWDAAFVAAKSLIDQVIAREEQLKKEREEDALV